MKRITACLFILAWMSSAAQNSSKDLNEMHQQIEQQRKKLDSSIQASDSLLSVPNSYYDSAAMARQMDNNIRNLNSLSESMRERENNQRQQAWLRIGIGLALGIVGITAALRKKKQKQNES
jgi:hypothetical protein